MNRSGPILGGTHSFFKRGIVLDFPANTVRNRNWMPSLIDQSGATHELHLLDVPDMICKERLRERNAGGKHPFQVSEAEYDLFTSYFVPPEPSEGFNVVVHTLTPAVIQSRSLAGDRERQAQ
jgi:AAA domain